MKLGGRRFAARLGVEPQAAFAIAAEGGDYRFTGGSGRAALRAQAEGNAVMR